MWPFNMWPFARKKSAEQIVDAAVDRWAKEKPSPSYHDKWLNAPHPEKPRAEPPPLSYTDPYRSMRHRPSAPPPTAPKSREDDSFDAAGFAIGMATGVPLSPTHGFSTGALLGAALHPSPAQASEPAHFSGHGGDSGGGGASTSYSPSCDSSPSVDSSSPSCGSD
jgi:hypothetical protein